MVGTTGPEIWVGKEDMLFFFVFDWAYICTAHERHPTKVVYVRRNIVDVRGVTCTEPL